MTDSGFGGILSLGCLTQVSSLPRCCGVRLGSGISFTARTTENGVRFISVARLVWNFVSASKELNELCQVEKLRGFPSAQAHFHSLLARKEFRPIADEVLAAMNDLAPARDIVFLVRAGGFAPNIYSCSILLNDLHRRTMVPIAFYYPGSAQHATDLSSYNLPTSTSGGVYNYRVKVHGVQA